jgi:uncharacterized protein (UPF0333 family)
MRLKPAGIIVILLIIGVLAYFALRPKMSAVGNENNTDLPNSTQGADKETTNANNNTANTTNTTTTGNTEERTFNYVP